MLMEVVNMFIRLLSNTHQFGWHVNKSTRSVRMIRGEIPLGTKSGLKGLFGYLFTLILLELLNGDKIQITSARGLRVRSASYAWLAACIVTLKVIRCSMACVGQDGGYPWL